MTWNSLSSEASNIHDRLGKSLRGLLRQILAHPTIDRAVRLFPRKFLGVRGWFRVWRTIGIAFERDGGHRDVGRCGEALLEILVPGLARGAEAPTIIVDDDVDIKSNPRRDAD